MNKQECDGRLPSTCQRRWSHSGQSDQSHSRPLTMSNTMKQSDWYSVGSWQGGEINEIIHKFKKWSCPNKPVAINNFWGRFEHWCRNRQSAIKLNLVCMSKSYERQRRRALVHLLFYNSIPRPAHNLLDWIHAGFCFLPMHQILEDFTHAADIPQSNKSAKDCKKTKQ